MRKYLRLLILFLALSSVILAMVFITPTRTRADFGDFAGDADYGDSGGGGGGGYDSDYDYGDGGGGGNIFAIFDGSPSSITAILITAGIIAWAYYKSKKGNAKRPVAPGAQPTTGLLPLDTIYKHDPDFSPEKMRERLSKLYIQMQNGWTARDISSLRGDFTDAQFAQYERQLNQITQARQTVNIERIAVLDVQLRGFQQDDQHDILVANLSTRITTYTTNDDTGEIVKGSRTDEKFMQYEWTLVRPRGSQTTERSADDAFNCPNCGAPVKINESAQCPYCSSVITLSQYDWVISGIKGLSKRTS